MDDQWQSGAGTTFWVGLSLFVTGVATVTATLASGVNTYANYLWLLATILLLAGTFLMATGLSLIYRWPKLTIVLVVCLLITSNAPVVLLAARPRSALAVVIATLSGLCNSAFYISHLRTSSHSNANES